MKNKASLYFSVLFFLLSPLLSENYLDRFRTPIYTTYSLSIGYDNNIFRLSESDISDLFDTSNPIVNSRTFDSAFLSPKLILNYKPQLTNKLKTELKFSVSSNQYYSSDDKSYNIYFSEIGIRFSPYNWLRLSHRLLPRYYLRNYIDHDTSILENSQCFFSSEGALLSYSHRIKGKSWLKIRYSATNLYYNANFTEFDTQISQIDLRLYTSILNFLNSFYGGISKGENVTFDSGYLTTTTDRSYIERQYGFSAKKNIKSKVINQFGFSSIIKNRIYETESVVDALHNGREHIEYNMMFWIKKEINTIDLSAKFKYRSRDVTSDYEWVRELKEFNKFEVIISVSYERALNILF